MEILELLWLLAEGCGCFLEVAAAGSNVGAGVAGYRARKGRKERLQANLPPQGPSRYFWIFLGLLFLGAFLTTLVVWKHLR